MVQKIAHPPRFARPLRLRIDLGLIFNISILNQY